MKIGILGGGQLGRMLLQKALNYDDDFYILDPSPQASCKDICHEFVLGNFNDYQNVLDFGQNKDLLTIEIEHVNVEALFELEKQGICIIPSPKSIEIIQQKQLQKNFYQQHNIPTPDYTNVANRQDFETKHIKFPFVQKLNKGGYDGKGVQIIKNEDDMHLFWDEASVIENLVNIEKELSIIVCKNKSGEISYFPVTEMLADPELNLLDFTICPAQITEKVHNQIQEIAQKFIHSIDSEGLFAIELFLDTHGKVWVNEVAPRLHNSAHQSQEGNYNCQFEQFYRVLKNLPLACVEARGFSGMLNLVGEKNHTGKVHYEGLNHVLKLPQTYVHLYGKTTTQPGRKMGHINCLAENREHLYAKLLLIKSKIKVITK